jgi:AraC family transcriptional regulator, regulatory protein of adaptative response / methylated-DNA-[protein]-cysteine methyltransferase
MSRLTLETAGEVDSTGWTILHGQAKTPFGAWLVAESPRGIVSLSFGECPQSEAELRQQWPGALFRRDDAVAEQITRSIFELPSEPLRVFVKGTAFQLAVWRELTRIPPGSTTTYAQLARSIGHPAATRAVGTAVGRNPLAYLIPCHRVIRSDGGLGGYRWGVERKEAMLRREKIARR